MPSVVDAIDVAARGLETCVLHASGRASCLGIGLMGDGTDVGYVHSLPVDVANVDAAAQVVLGGVEATRGIALFGCLLRRTGGVACWESVLGAGRGSVELAPIDVRGVTDAVTIAAGDRTVCAVRGSGEVLCWGDGSGGLLGDPALDGTDTPVRIPHVDDARGVALTQKWACAVRNAGDVVCWGDFGDGVVPRWRYVVTRRAVEVVGGEEHACARLEDGRVVCWGANIDGQLGQPASVESSDRPLEVRGVSDVVALSAGAKHTCAVERSGRVACWGDDGEMQLGRGELPVPRRSRVRRRPTAVTDASAPRPGR